MILNQIQDSLLQTVQDFTLAHFEIALEARGSGFLPAYLGSTLRGAFGWAFKETVCMVDHRECDRCLLNKRCPYTYIFETWRPAQAVWMKKYDRVPHPFILFPPMVNKTNWKAGEFLKFEFTLFGQAIEMIPYLILSWDKMGKKGLGKKHLPFVLHSVSKQELSTGEKTTIYLSGQELMGTPENWLSSLANCIPSHPKSGIVTLKLTSPMRLQNEGKIQQKQIPFSSLVGSLLRRLSMLTYFHNAHQVEIPFQELVEQAKEVKILNQNLKWQDFQRYSTRQKQKMNLGGLVGTIAYDQNAIPFYPLLFLGQYLHVGKNTSFGLGKYELIDA